MSVASRMGEARRNIVTAIADQFELSGTAYTCRKVVMDYAAPIIPYYLARSEAQPFALASAFKSVNLQRDIADEVHRRWKTKKQPTQFDEGQNRMIRLKLGIEGE